MSASATASSIGPRGVWKTGSRSEGATYSIFSLPRKVGQAVSAAAASYAIGLDGHLKSAAVRPAGGIDVVLKGLTVSNGVEWSPDGTLAYHNDTATHTIAVYDYDREAGLSGRRVFAALEHRPDGLTADAQGAVWTALSNGGAVRRYAADGELNAVIELPVRRVTACTFGGAGLVERFIPTSREGLAPGEDPPAGALFRAVPGVREFAG